MTLHILKGNIKDVILFAIKANKFASQLEKIPQLSDEEYEELYKNFIKNIKQQLVSLEDKKASDEPQKRERKPRITIVDLGKE